MSEISRVFMPFSKWSPDGGDIGNAGMPVVLNIVPYANHYIPLYPRTQKTAALTGIPLGVGLNTVAGNTAGWKLYYGDDNDLYEIDPDGSPNWTETEISKATGTYTAPGEWGWQFLSFGKNVIACNGDSDPVQYRADGAGDFADMITSTEKPRFNFMAVLGGISQGLQIVGVGVGATGLTSMPSGDDVFAVSDVDDIRTFLEGGILSDSLQYPDDYGGYTGVAGGLDFGALLFKEHIIYMLDNSGPSGFEVRPVHVGDGTKYPNSIFVRGQTVFFWSTDGNPSFWSINDGYNKISKTTFTRILQDSSWNTPGVNAVQDDNGSKIYLSGAYDPIMGGMIYSYRSSSAVSVDYCDRLLSIDVDSDDGIRFSLSDVSESDGSLKSKILRVISVPQKQGEFSSYPSMVVLAEDNNDIKFSIFDIKGTDIYDQSVKFGFGFLPHPDISAGDKLKSWHITQVKPVVSLGEELRFGAPPWRATITWKDRPWDEEDSITVESTTSVNNEGFLDVSQKTDFGFLNKVELEFDVTLQAPSNPIWFINYVGVEITYETGGSSY